MGCNTSNIEVISPRISPSLSLPLLNHNPVKLPEIPEITEPIQTTNINEDNLLKKIQIPFRNLEFFTLIWIDENVKNKLDYQLKFRQIINQLKIYENPSEYQTDFEQELNKNEKYILIISGTGKTRQLIISIHHHPQISTCYVLCQKNSKKLNQQWALNFSKIKGVFDNIDDLLIEFSIDQKIREKTEDSSISINIYNRNSLESRNALFLYFQLFIDIILNISNQENDQIKAKQDLILICKQNYQGNENELEIIDEFDRTYEKDKSIWWYTRESCFYRLLNKALRLQDFDILFSMRFFIIDLYYQLNQQHQKSIKNNKSIIKVYRGQAIHINELNLIRQNIGEFLSMNSFLSTSLNKQVSINFAKQIISTDELTKILFEFNIDQNIENTRPYAFIKHFSYYTEEDELLIGLGPIFQINKIDFDQIEQIWICNMSLCSQDNYQLIDIMERDKKNIGQNITSLGYLLYQMGDKDKAKQYFKQLLNNQQSLNLLDISSCYRGLGAISFAQDDFHNALDYHKKELEIYQNISPPVPQFYIGDCYICIGNIYKYLNQLDLALSYQEKALNLLPEDHPSYPTIYRNIADIYVYQKQYDLAIENYNKCLSIQQIILPDGHPHIGTTYANIGAMYGNIFDSKQALIYYQKAKDIWIKSRPPTHPDILQLQENIQICNDRVEWEEQQKQNTQ